MLPDNTAIVVHQYVSREDDELDIQKGEKLHIINRFPDEWYLVQNSKGSLGVVPANHLREAALMPTHLAAAASPASSKLKAAEEPPATPRNSSRSGLSPGPFSKIIHKQPQPHSQQPLHQWQQQQQQQLSAMVERKKEATRSRPQKRLVEAQVPRENHAHGGAGRDKENFLDRVFALPEAILGPILEGGRQCSCFKMGADENSLLAQRRSSPPKNPSRARGDFGRGPR